MRSGRVGDDSGQVTPVVAVALLGLVAMAALVVDGGLLFSARRSLQALADAAAQAGAMEVDGRVLRESQGRVVQLDAVAAEAAVDGYLEAARFAGSAHIDATPSEVDVRLSEERPTLLLSLVGLRTVGTEGSAVARPRSGVREPGNEMTGRARTLVIGAILTGVVVGVLVVGYLLVGPGSRPGETPPSPRPTSPSPATTDVREEVERAYLRYWQVWTEANLKLDPDLLDEVMTGEALQKARGVIERANNEPVSIRVSHSYRITILSDAASIEDTFVDRSVRVDPRTGKPIGPEQNETIRNGYTLKKVDETWKVSFIVGYESPSPPSS